VISGAKIRQRGLKGTSPERDINRPFLETGDQKHKGRMFFSCQTVTSREEKEGKTLIGTEKLRHSTKGNAISNGF